MNSIEPTTEPPVPNPNAALAARRLRLIELLLVLSVAFAIPIYSSLAILFSGYHESRAVAGDSRIASTLLFELLGLAVLFYVLFRQGRSVFAIGGDLRPLDFLSALGLAIFAVIGSRLCFAGVQAIYAATGHSLASRAPQNIPRLSLPLLAVVLMVVNAAHEELIVRAYTMSELMAMRCGAGVAGLVSVVVQTSYHFYQGRRSRFLTRRCSPFSRFTSRKRAASRRLCSHICILICSRCRICFAIKNAC